MIINQHVLLGCSPTPLAHYLKALGILRLIAEQKDAQCRGAWRDDHFVLATVLTRQEVARFFLEEYEPTAIVDPWNGGSGFYPKDNKKGIDALLASTHKRFHQFKGAVEWTRQATLGWTEAPDKSDKLEFQMKCLREWRGGTLDAMMSAVVIIQDGDGRSYKASYPALLGTGWNDGRLDFANNYAQRLADLFDCSRKRARTPEEEATASMRAMEDAAALLALSLYNSPAPATKKGLAIGQFLPGAAGGANSTNAPDGESQINPWDFVLMLEGAILFAPAATKRLGPSAQTQASAPFALRSHAAGGGTFEAGEESSRGEQWLPLWERFASLAEIRKLFEEGRAQVGRSHVARPIDMARAITRLGVARGISGFERYGYLERNGQSNFAVPLGHIPVGHAPWSRLVDDLISWLDRLMRAARDAAPARLAQAERRLSDAVFAALTHDHNPILWQEILIAAARVETVQASGIAVRVGPIPPLGPEWILACDDGSSAFRLAVALGSAHAPYSSKGKIGGSVRHHWLPLKQWCRAYAASDERIARDLRVVATNRDPCLDLIAMLERRHLESQQADQRHPQLLSPEGARMSDLDEWVAGKVDAQRCIELARAFMAVDWGVWKSSEYRLSPTRSGNSPDDAWAVLRLCCLPFALDSNLDIPLDPEILRRLEIGDLAEAFRLASQRLHAHGVHPTVRQVMADSRHARWWASGLAFPVSHPTARRLLAIVQPTASKEDTHVRSA